MSNIQRLKEISYQANMTLWRVSILGKIIDSDRVISISDLEQQLDYPDLNEFTVSNTTITVRDPNEEFSPHNKNNFFTQNGGIKSGFRASVKVEAGLRDGDQDCYVTVFSGEVIQFSRNEKGATATIQASDRTQEIRNKNITNFGITKTFSIEEESSRTHGNYEVPPAIGPISQHSITRLYAPDERPDYEKRADEDRTFELYPGVGTPAFVGPNSPYLYEQETLETEGDLRGSNNYEVTDSAIRIERGALESPLNVTCKVPYRNKNITTLVKQILNHTESPRDYDPNAKILRSYAASKTNTFKGNLPSDPTDAEENDFYYNTTSGSIRVYTGTSWISSTSSDVDERREVKQRLNRINLTITHNDDYVYTLDEPDISPEAYKYPIIWKNTSDVIRIAILQVSNQRSFGIDETQTDIDIPPLILPTAHFASRGRIGYDFEMHQDRDKAPQWHWNGFPTDMVYDAKGGESGRYYFLYTTPAYIESSNPEGNTSEDRYILSRLIQYDVETSIYTILYQEEHDPTTFSVHTTHEFWRLAHFATRDTDYFYIMTANSNIEDNRPQLASYDPEEVSDSSRQHLIQVQRTKSNNRITSQPISFGNYKPQLAHFHKFSTTANEVETHTGVKTVSTADKYGRLPDTRRSFFADDTGLYYAFWKEGSPGTFGYAKASDGGSVGTPIFSVNHDNRVNHIGFDFVQDDSGWCAGYIVQNPEGSILKIIGTV